ncbi:SRPBCC family protein [Octadecabacter sp.]|nr:SRPBCC family protein [Octadecabacter sp.]
MKISTREDIEAPIDYVFKQVIDFGSFERSIMRRGGDVERTEKGGANGLGAKWRVKFHMRGMERDVEATVSEVTEPTSLTMDVTSRSADAVLNVELVPLSRARTRLNIHAEASAKTIATKLLFQSVRFAKQKTEGRFKSIVAGFARDVEKRHRR